MRTGICASVSTSVMACFKCRCSTMDTCTGACLDPGHSSKMEALSMFNSQTAEPVQRSEWSFDVAIAHRKTA